MHFKNMYDAIVNRAWWAKSLMSSENHGKLKVLGLGESSRAGTPGNWSLLSMEDSRNICTSYLHLPREFVQKITPNQVFASSLSAFKILCFFCWDCWSSDGSYEQMLLVCDLDTWAQDYFIYNNLMMYDSKISLVCPCRLKGRSQFPLT